MIDVICIGIMQMVHINDQIYGQKLLFLYTNTFHSEYSIGMDLLFGSQWFHIWTLWTKQSDFCFVFGMLFPHSLVGKQKLLT